MRFRKRPPSFHRNFREYPLRVILFRFVICDICCKSFVFLPFKFVVAFIEKRQPEAIGTRVEKGRLKTCRNLLAHLLACDHGIKKLLPAQPRSKPYMGIVSFVCKTWSLLPLCVIVPFILPIVMSFCIHWFFFLFFFFVFFRSKRMGVIADCSTFLFS